MAEPPNIMLIKLNQLREEMTAGFASLREEQVRTNENVTAIARTLVTAEYPAKGLWQSVVSTTFSHSDMYRSSAL